jgi:hypothetical protein
MMKVPAKKFATYINLNIIGHGLTRIPMKEASFQDKAI